MTADDGDEMISSSTTYSEYVGNAFDRRCEALRYAVAVQYGEPWNVVLDTAARFEHFLRTGEH